MASKGLEVAVSNGVRRPTNSQTCKMHQKRHVFKGLVHSEIKEIIGSLTQVHVISKIFILK